MFRSQLSLLPRKSYLMTEGGKLIGTESSVTGGVQSILGGKVGTYSREANSKCSY